MSKTFVLILVSGGSGLVGSYLLRELVKNGEEVRALYRSDESLKKAKFIFQTFGEEANFNKVDWVKANILDLPQLEESFKGVRTVYHCAAIVSFKKGDAQSMIETNVEGTANMVNLAVANGIEKFCFVSSVASLGKYRDGSCADEETIWQKIDHTSDYSISKFYSENEVWRASEEGLKVVIVNPSTIIGFGDWNQSSNSIFKRVHEGLPFYPGGSTGFVAVEDVVDSMISLMRSDISNQRFVVSGENLEFKQLFDWIADGLGKKKAKYPLKKWQAMLYIQILRLFSFLTFSKPKLTALNVHTAFNKRCYDNQKIKKAINIEFRSIEDTVKRNSELYIKFYIDSNSRG